MLTGLPQSGAGGSLFKGHPAKSTPVRALRPRPPPDAAWDPQAPSPRAPPAYLERVAARQATEMLLELLCQLGGVPPDGHAARALRRGHCSQHFGAHGVPYVRLGQTI